jgi:hypothetical protein
MDVGGRQALINRANRGRKSKGEKGGNHGRAGQLRAYCPHCAPVPGDPELSSHVVVTRKTKRTNCRFGHSFRSTDGQSYAGEVQ